MAEPSSIETIMAERLEDWAYQRARCHGMSRPIEILREEFPDIYERIEFLNAFCHNVMVSQFFGRDIKVSKRAFRLPIFSKAQEAHPIE